MRNKAFIFLAMLMLLGCQSAKESAAEDPSLKAFASPSGAQASLPYLLKGGDELLYLSWVEKQDSGWMAFKYSVLKNSKWTTPETIASGNDWFINWADYPMMAVDNDGNMMAHYLAKSSSGTYSYDVNVMYKSKNGDWSAPIVPHNDGTPTEHGFVTMLPTNDGTFLLSWLDGRFTGGGDHDAHMEGGAMTIRTAILDMNGTITARKELDNRVCDCCQTGGAMTSEGPIIVYRDRTHDEMRDMSYVRFVNGNWTEPSKVYADGWNITGCPVNGPRMASRANTTAIAWFTAADGVAKVKASFMENGQFQEPIIIDDSVSVGRVDVTIVDAHTAIISWLDLSNETPLITFRSVSKDGTLGEPVVVAQTSASRGSGFPQMELVGDNVYFAWTNVDTSGTSIQMKYLPKSALK